MPASLAIPELDWGYQDMWPMLMWKLAPNGFTLLFEDMTTLPFDRVMVEERRPDHIKLRFAGVKAAKRLKDPTRGKERATVSELQGKYTALVACTLWHFVRFKQLGADDSVTLTPYDRDAVPSDKVLLMSGYSQGIEWRWVSHEESRRMTAWYRENEQPGAFVREKTNL
jgi:hypothetical protein